MSAYSIATRGLAGRKVPQGVLTPMSAYSIATRGLAGRKVPQGTLTAMGELLFSASEPGAWYDPSDMSTLFQDSEGTVPVTAVEQPVGRILDKSGRGNHATQATTTKRPTYSRRVNLLTNSEQFEDGVWFKGGHGGGLPPAVIANDASGPASDGFADKVTFSVKPLTGETETVVCAWPVLHKTTSPGSRDKLKVAGLAMMVMLALLTS